MKKTGGVAEVGFHWPGSYEGARQRIESLVEEVITIRGHISKRKLRTVAYGILASAAPGSFSAAVLSRTEEFTEFLGEARDKLSETGLEERRKAGLEARRED